MSLDVQAPTGLGAHAEAQLHEKLETLDVMMLEVMKEGFMPSSRPAYAPPIIDAAWLTELTPARYHELTTQLSAWKTYAEELINTVKCGLEECETELKLLTPAIKKRIREVAELNREKKPSEDTIKDAVLTDPRFIEITRREQMLTQKLLLVEPHAERYGRDLRIISRALEMRRQELGFGGFNGGENGVRNPNGPQRNRWE